MHRLVYRATDTEIVIVACRYSNAARWLKPTLRVAMLPQSYIYRRIFMKRRALEYIDILATMDVIEKGSRYGFPFFN